MNNNTREFTKSEVDKLFDADLLWLEDENGDLHTSVTENILNIILNESEK